MILTSKDNPIVKKYSSLKDKKFRREYGLFLIEGSKMVKEAVLGGYKIESVIVAQSYGGDIYGDNPVITVSDPLFSFMSDEKTPQGIMAVAKIPREELIPPTDNALLLDGLQDPGNIGGIIRSANAAGYKQIYLINCSDPYSPKSVRAAMSGLFFVKLYFGDYDKVISALDKVPIISTDMSGKNIFSFVPPEKFVLAIGNEGNGLSPEVRKKSSYTVKIPMDATAESLNAGVSAGIAMYILKSYKFKH